MKLVVVVYFINVASSVTFIEHESKEQFMVDYRKGVDDDAAYWSKSKALCNEMQTARAALTADDLTQLFSSCTEYTTACTEYIAARAAFDTHSELRRGRPNGIIVNGIGYPTCTSGSNETGVYVETHCRPVLYTLDEWFDINCATRSTRLQITKI